MKLYPTRYFTCMVLISSITLAQSANKPDEPDLVNQALAAVEGGLSEGWAFTEKRIQNEHVTVMRFDPREPAGERWTLISIDDRPPTPEERKKAIDRREKRSEDSKSNSASINIGDLGAMIEPGSPILIEENATYAIYAFVPVTEDEKMIKLYRYLDGTLEIIKSGPYVASVTMLSPRPFSPRFGINMTRFNMTMTYEPVVANGPVLLTSVTVQLQGAVLGILKFGDNTEITYDDYEYVGK